MQLCGHHDRQTDGRTPLRFSKERFLQDHEVEEQLAQMASDEREDRERELLDAQRKALADQKREELAKKVGDSPFRFEIFLIG